MEQWLLVYHALFISHKHDYLAGVTHLQPPYTNLGHLMKENDDGIPKIALSKQGLVPCPSSLWTDLS